MKFIIAIALIFSFPMYNNAELPKIPTREIFIVKKDGSFLINLLNLKGEFKKCFIIVKFSKNEKLLNDTVGYGYYDNKGRIERLIKPMILRENEIKYGIGIVINNKVSKSDTLEFINTGGYFFRTYVFLKNLRPPYLYYQFNYKIQEHLFCSLHIYPKIRKNNYIASLKFSH